MGYTKVGHYPEGKQGWIEAGLPRERGVLRIVETYAAFSCLAAVCGTEAADWRKSTLPYKSEQNCSDRNPSTEIAGGIRPLPGGSMSHVLKYPKNPWRAQCA